MNTRTSQGSEKSRRLTKKVAFATSSWCVLLDFFFQAEDGIRDYKVTGVQTCALPIWPRPDRRRLVADHQGGRGSGRERLSRLLRSGIRWRRQRSSERLRLAARRWSRSPKDRKSVV